MGVVGEFAGVGGWVEVVFEEESVLVFEGDPFAGGEWVDGGEEEGASGPEECGHVGERLLWV